MLTVSLLVCAMMALTRANDNNDTVHIVAPDLDTRSHTLINHNQKSCLTGWELFNGRCFKHVTEKHSWAKAEQNCQSNGGHLASAHNAEDYNKMQQMTESTSWIGGSACQETGAWFWSDGTSMDYLYWCGAQPDNTLDTCCLQMNTGDGKCWDDQPCSTLLPSICVKG